MKTLLLITIIFSIQNAKAELVFRADKTYTALGRTASCGNFNLSNPPTQKEMESFVAYGANGFNPPPKQLTYQQSVADFKAKCYHDMANMADYKNLEQRLADQRTEQIILVQKLFESLPAKFFADPRFKEAVEALVQKAAKESETKK